MDLLRTLLLYMTLLYTSSVQSMPDVDGVMAAMVTPTPEIVQPTATPVPTPSPTPVPTVEVSVNPEYKTLNMGSKGDDVVRLQETLKQHGYYSGEVDGRYGNQTRVAVELFQYCHGLSADGIAGRHTLTVLYDSNQVRPAPTPTGTPEPQVTETPEETPAPTLVPTAAPTETPAPTDTPAPTAEPEFLPMEGWVIQVEGQAAPLAVSSGSEGETAAVVPYSYGDLLYVPLKEVLESTGITVLSADIDSPGYAFALGNNIFLLSYGADQNGNPINLEIFKDEVRQLMPVRDIRLVDEMLYLPCESITELMGITFEKGDQQVLIVRMPSPQNQ
ncbi:MAG: hypothetical protein E7331_06970 [Clostridiales bacterium]|nr:hypothetical protein [Clostridiales bacterium]